MDRRPTGATTIAAFIALVALIIFAITSDERDQTSGRMAPRGKWAPTRNRPGPAAASLLVVTIIGSVFIASAVEDTVPHDGILDWRVDSGLPSDVYGGSLSYNPFIGIRQQIVGGSQTPAFIATIVSQDVPADEVYFRFMTLEDYDGSKFSVSQSELLDLEDPVWENPDHRFAGPSALLATRVAILALDMQWLPAPAVPVAVEAISGRFGPYLRIRSEDGAILFDGGRTVNGMQYRVDASIPRPDLSVLATNQETGQLSIAFRTALEDADLPDDLVPQPVVVEVRDEPPDASRFLDLPVNDPLARIPAIADLAEEQTRNLETEFEKGIALEAFLRSFSYTTNIDPGHGAEDLAAWLLDPGSPNYRTGYCENFSTAMAVMARTLGIHSRVVLGFTPGEPSLTQSSAVIVRDRNAHAWVELWMPSQGWVRFDPTPRPDLINPSTANLSADELQFAVTEYFDDIEIPDTPANPRGESPVIGGTLPDVDIIVPPPSPIDTDTGPSLPGWVRWAAPVLVLLLLVGGGMPALKAWRHRRRLHRLRNGDVTAAWEDIVVRLGDLGRPVSPTRTPAEIASGVDEAMAPLAAVYGRAIYGPPNGGASEEEIAVAGAALADTRELLAAGTTRRQRIAAWYRPGRRVRRR
jgi:transglutaminase-like putative cysteine protease